VFSYIYLYILGKLIHDHIDLFLYMCFSVVVVVVFLMNRIPEMRNK
jgi:hypothetical protein